MTTSSRSSQGAAALRKGCLITGAIQGCLLRGEDVLPLTEGPRAIGLHGVADRATMMAMPLAMILTVVGYLQWKGEKPPFWRTFAWLSTEHGLLPFILPATPSLLWHQLVGSTQVTLAAPNVILAAIAGLIAGASHAMSDRVLSRTAAALPLASSSR